MTAKLKAALDNFDEESFTTGLMCMDPTRTKQEFKEECDIMTIVERFGLTGEVPQVLRLPEAGDFTGIFDYQTAMNALVATRETFDQLPYKIKDRFNNDPAKFYDFVTNEENEEEIYRLGLAKKPPEPVKPEPVEVRVVGTPEPVKTP